MENKDESGGTVEDPDITYEPLMDVSPDEDLSRQFRSMRDEDLAIWWRTQRGQVQSIEGELLRATVLLESVRVVIKERSARVPSDTKKS